MNFTMEDIIKKNVNESILNVLQCKQYELDWYIWIYNWVKRLKLFSFFYICYIQIILYHNNQPAAMKVVMKVSMAPETDESLSPT